MTLLFKLTDADDCTRGPTRWGENVTHRAAGAGAALCSGDVIHACRSPWLAWLMAPALMGLHPLDRPRLWSAEGAIVADGGVKVGVKALTTLSRLPVREVSLEQRVIFAIRCALPDAPSEFAAWAAGWLAGDDRSEQAAARAESVCPASAHARRHAAQAAQMLGQLIAGHRMSPLDPRAHDAAVAGLSVQRALPFVASCAAHCAALAAAPIDFPALADEICGPAP